MGFIRAVGQEFTGKYSFWIDTGMWAGFSLFTLFQTYDYAYNKSKQQAGKTLSAYHYTLRPGLTVVFSLSLFAVGYWHPDHNATMQFLHMLSFAAVLVDGIAFRYHTTVMEMPALLGMFEAFLGVLFGFGVATNGRITTPVIFVICLCRLLGALQWPGVKEAITYDLIIAILCATLSVHWFPLDHAFNVWFASAGFSKPDLDKDIVFLSNLFLGIVIVMGLLRLFVLPLTEKEQENWVQLESQLRRRQVQCERSLGNVPSDADCGL